MAGHVDDPGVGERIGTWVRAAAGWHDAHSLRVVRFGDNMRDVAVTEGDKVVEAQVQLGFSVDGHGIGDLVAASSAASREIVEALLTDYADQYELAAELRPGGARRTRSLRPLGSKPDCARSSMNTVVMRSPTPSRICTACRSSRELRHSGS